MQTVTWCYSVEWIDPYKEPPAGFQRVVARAERTGRRGIAAPPIPDEIVAAWRAVNDAYAAATGSNSAPYFIVVTRTAPVLKRRNREETFEYRRKLAIERLRRKRVPDLEQAVREAFSRDPAYYGLTAEQAREWRLSDET